MSKKTYITTARIEDRDKGGKKSIIEANKEVELTDAQAKKLGSAVRLVESEAPEDTDDDGDTGGEGGGQ